MVLEGDKNFGEESTSAIKINRPGRVLQRRKKVKDSNDQVGVLPRRTEIS